MSEIANDCLTYHALKTTGTLRRQEQWFDLVGGSFPASAGKIEGIPCTAVCLNPSHEDHTCEFGHLGRACETHVQ